MQSVRNALLKAVITPRDSAVIRLFQKPLLVIHCPNTKTVEASSSWNFWNFFKPYSESFGTLGSICSWPCNSCKIKMWMHYVKARLKMGVNEIQASSRLIVHFQLDTLFPVSGNWDLIKLHKLVSLPTLWISSQISQRCENLMASWVSEWCWTPSFDLLLLLNSACLTVPPWLPCWAFSFSEQLWSEQQRCSRRRSWFNTKLGGTGPTCCSWASVCIPMLKSTLPAGSSGLDGLQQEVWGGGKPAGFQDTFWPSLWTSGTCTE